MNDVLSLSSYINWNVDPINNLGREDVFESHCFLQIPILFLVFIHAFQTMQFLVDLSISTWSTKEQTRLFQSVLFIDPESSKTSRCCINISLTSSCYVELHQLFTIVSTTVLHPADVQTYLQRKKNVGQSLYYTLCNII